MSLERGEAAAGTHTGTHAERTPSASAGRDPRLQPAQTALADRQLLTALGGLDADRTRAVSTRTRRAVQDAAADMREGRQLNRRNLGVALLILGGILILLSPAIWNSLDELLGGEFFFDLPGMVAALVFTLFAAVAAVLFLLGGAGEHRLGDSRR